MPSTEVQAKSQAFYKRWDGEIADALKREKRYRETGRQYVEIYEARKSDDVPFAILYSNTETLLPAVYNAKPIPIINRRFRDADPLGKAVSEVGTRLLKYLIDVESKDYDNFDDLMVSAALEAILVSRGLVRFKYTGDMETECVYGEAVRWDKFSHGYARTWKKVPWICFEWDMSEAELKANFPDVKFDLKNISTTEDMTRDGESKEELTGVKTYKVFEVWNKLDRKVHFFSPAWPEGALKSVDDPLGLVNFFPVPKPMNFMKKVTTLTPTPLYEQYRQQAQELNDITRRLKAIIKAVKVRGAYNSTIEGIDKILSADDNEMIPVENMASMPDNTGIDKILYIVPITDLVSAAQSLYQQREQIKQVIYEITGISDILRGASVASETATAQNIKNQWGTLRLKRAQKEVQRFCRDSLAILLEIAGAKFELKTIQQMTGLQFLTNEQKGQIQQQQQIMEMQAQQAAMMQPQGVEGQSAQSAPQPPQLPPELMELLKLPSWEDILEVLHNDIVMSYKIDIETNSTIDAEASQDKQDIAELLNGVSQFLNGVAPLVEKGLLPMEVAKGMLLTISRRFNFGPQLEEALEKMQAPQPAGPDPAVQAKAEAEKMKMAGEQQKMQMELQVLKAETDSKMQLMQLQMEIDQAELEIKKAELEIQRQGLAMKAQSQQHQHNLKMQQMDAKAKEAKEPADAAV